MRYHIGLGFILVSVLLLGSIFFSTVAVALPQAEEANVITASALKVQIDAEPLLSAKAYAVFDVQTGEILWGKETALVLPIASVTKLVTAAVLEESFLSAATTTIKISDVETEGESGKLQVSEIYTYHDLLFPLLLESSNDAATALNSATLGQLLVKMTEQTSLLGAENTVLADTSGLSDQNVSTVDDLVLITTALYRDHPHIFDISTINQYIGPYTGWLNNNPVHNMNGYRGGKHGYTTSARRTLVAVFDEEVKGETHTLGYVILGSDNLVSDVELLRSFVTNSAS